jgi:hypothetical protein
VRVEAATTEDLGFVVVRAQCALTPGARGIKATDAAGAVRGVVAYDLWTENAVWAHMAVDTPIAWRSLIPACFKYPFVECGRDILLAAVPSHNTASWGLCKHLGLTIKHVVRDGWARGDDLLLLELRRADCRFLRS